MKREEWIVELMAMEDKKRKRSVPRARGSAAEGITIIVIIIAIIIIFF